MVPKSHSRTAAPEHRQRHPGQGGADFDRRAVVCQTVGERLLERLDGLRFQPRRIVEIGCATGRQTLALRERYPDADLIALEARPDWLTAARRRRGRWRRRFLLVKASGAALPLAEHSVDLAFANFSLHRSSDLGESLDGLRRIVRPGGLILLTLPGPDLFRELIERGAQIEPDHRVEAQRLGDALIRAGFQEPVLDTDWLTVRHNSVAELRADLEASGFRCRLPDALERAPGRDGRPGDDLAITWEIVYASAWAPEEGQPIRSAEGETASISLANLTIRRR